MHYHGHRERLRARLRENPEGLADYETLELLLAQVLPRRDTKPLAKELLRRFQSVKGALDAKPAELMTLKGFGPALSDAWLLWREILARYAESAPRRHETLASPEEVARMAKARLAGQDREEVWLAFVDAQNRLLAWEKGQKGSIDEAAFYPREILERALTLKASGFILVHNHPGGKAAPSGADLEATKRLQEAARTVDLRFLDHLIVTADESFSIMGDRRL
ncbi:MAG: DNA repair protein RadC [Desulfovibrionaceae bacterium]|nr:DNA repair protein RadC [Desulfovibrionaceae bacterium]